MNKARNQTLLGQILGLAIYLSLAVVGAILVFWGIMFAAGAMLAFATIYFCLRIFGLAPKRRAPPPTAENSAADSKTEAADIIELKKKSDGSYE